MLQRLPITEQFKTLLKPVHVCHARRTEIRMIPVMLPLFELIELIRITADSV
jgi:hypothetical protein